MAAFLGNEAEGRALLAPLRDLGPERDTFAMVPPVVLGDLAMDPLDPLPFHLTHQLLDELPAETIDELMAKVGPDSGRGPTVTMLQFRHMGGALARETPGAGARATLPGRDLHAGARRRHGRGVRRRGPRRAGRRRRRALHRTAPATTPTSSRCRPTRAASSRPTSGSDCARSRLRYDPSDVFVGNHHIPPAERVA